MSNFFDPGVSFSRSPTDVLANVIARHPLPWSIAWYDPGQSIGYASNAKILDARRNVVVILGDGAADTRQWQEELARFIVNAANSQPLKADDFAR